MYFLLLPIFPILTKTDKSVKIIFFTCNAIQDYQEYARFTFKACDMIKLKNKEDCEENVTRFQPSILVLSSFIFTRLYYLHCLSQLKLIFKKKIFCEEN